MFDRHPPIEKIETLDDALRGIRILIATAPPLSEARRIAGMIAEFLEKQVEPHAS